MQSALAPQYKSDVLGSMHTPLHGTGVSAGQSKAVLTGTHSPPTRCCLGGQLGSNASAQPFRQTSKTEMVKRCDFEFLISNLHWCCDLRFRIPDSLGFSRKYFNHMFWILDLRGPSPLRRYLQANTRLPPMRGYGPATPCPCLIQIFPMNECRCIRRFFCVFYDLSGR